MDGDKRSAAAASGTRSQRVDNESRAAARAPASSTLHMETLALWCHKHSAGAHDRGAPSARQGQCGAQWSSCSRWAILVCVCPASHEAMLTCAAPTACVLSVVELVLQQKIRAHGRHAREREGRIEDGRLCRVRAVRALDNGGCR